MRLPSRGDGLVGQADLLHGRDETDRRHTDPTPLLGDEHPEQAELAHLPEKVGGTPSLLPGLRGPGGDLLLGEVTAEIDKILLRLAEGEIHDLLGPSGDGRILTGQLALHHSGPGGP
jgi:hypothetical protein